MWLTDLAKVVLGALLTTVLTTASTLYGQKWLKHYDSELAMKRARWDAEFSRLDKLKEIAGQLYESLNTYNISARLPAIQQHRDAIHNYPGLLAEHAALANAIVDLELTANIVLDDRGYKGMREEQEQMRATAKQQFDTVVTLANSLLDGEQPKNRLLLPRWPRIRGTVTPQIGK